MVLNVGLNRYKCVRDREKERVKEDRGRETHIKREEREKKKESSKR